MIRVRKYWTDGLEGARIWYHITRWCVDELGMPGPTGDWNYLSASDYMDFYFRDQQMAELFILKWM